MKRFLGIWILLMLLLGGCALKQNTVKVSSVGEYFGTVLTITLYGADEKELAQIISDAFAECARMEMIFSAKREDSELAKVNDRAADTPVEISPELYEVLDAALMYNARTEGALDISIGGLISLWGIGTPNERVPAEDELSAYAGKNGCQYILLDAEKRTVEYAQSFVRIDLGAVAKGYCANRIKEYLLQKNQNLCGILDFGGNIVTIEAKADGSAWNIGITDPKNPSGICASVSIKDLCVVTSGNYERYFEQDGIRYHHILNPQDGCPADSGVLSATIIGADSMQCDALSTACFILGVEQGMALVEGLDDIEAVLIDSEGGFHLSSGMEKYNFQKR